MRMTARRHLTFMLLRGTGQGGIARTVINLANHLVDHYDVRLISVYRKRDAPVFPIDRRIEVEHLIDLRPDAPSDLTREEPSALVPFDTYLSAASDRAIVDTVSRVPSDTILISTRPSMNLIAARHVPPGVLTVGQEHLNFQVRKADPQWFDLVCESVAALDAWVTLTEGDAADYRGQLADADTLITSIPNAISWPIGEPSPLTGKLIVAAGRLAEQKAYHRMIDAYAPVARERPDWQLHIYGTGEDRRELRQRIRRHRIGPQVKLPGFTQEMPEVMRRASGYAMSSIYEGFPMVLLEAMTSGLPMIAYDCPRGPAEIIDNGLNGWLVPDGDQAAYTQALYELIDDPERRAAMGAQAWRDAHAYEMPTIAGRWRELLDSLGSS
jgi:glycosyltransferase involved in cell wall biosynthesis